MPEGNGKKGLEPNYRPLYAACENYLELICNPKASGILLKRQAGSLLQQYKKALLSDPGLPLLDNYVPSYLWGDNGSSKSCTWDSVSLTAFVGDLMKVLEARAGGGYNRRD